MSGHGPDAQTFEKASAAAALSRPDVITGTMAFMFETRCVLRPTRHAMAPPRLQPDCCQCWLGVRKHFNPDTP